MTIAETLRELITTGDEKAINLVMELVNTIKILDMTTEQILVLRELLHRSKNWPRRCEECGMMVELHHAKPGQPSWSCPHCNHLLGI